MNNGPIRLSKSQINMFGHCPRQWMYRYIEGRKVPPSGAMKLGLSFHDAIANNYTAKAASQKDLPLDEMTDYFSDSFKQGLQQEEVIFDEGETPDSLRDTGVGIVKAHHTTIAPNVFPMSAETVEQKTVMTIGKDGDENQFELVAIVDLVDRDNIIREAKSANKRPTEMEIAKHVDLTTYALSRRMATREVEAGLALDVAVKTKTPAAVSYPTTRTREHLRFHLNRIAHIAKSIRAEAYPPNTDFWGCSEKWCGYWSICVGKGLTTTDMGENLEPQLKESIRHAEEAKQANAASARENGEIHQQEKVAAAAPVEKEKPSEGRKPRRRGSTPSLFPS